MHFTDVCVQTAQFFEHAAAVHAREQRNTFSLRVNPLDVGVQVPLLGERGRAEHAEVRFLSGVSHHVGLQHHLLVESLPTMCALERPLTCVYSNVSDQLAGLLERLPTVMAAVREPTAINVFLVVSGTRGEWPHLHVTLHVLLQMCGRLQLLVAGLAGVHLDA